MTNDKNHETENAESENTNGKKPKEDKSKKDGSESTKQATERLVDKITWKHYFFFFIHLLQSAFSAISYPCMRQYLYAKIANEHIKNTSFAINSTFDTGGNSLCWSQNASVDRDDTQQTIQAETAMWTMYVNIATGIPQTMLWFYLGYLTDMVGRKPMMIVNNMGFVMRLAIYAVVIKWDLPKFYLLIACFFDGISGAYSGYNLLSAVYTADITKKGKMRGFFITAIYSVTDICYGAVNLTAGYVINIFGFFWPIAITAIALFILNIKIHFFVAETLQHKSKLKDFSPKKGIQSVVSFYVHDKTENGEKTRLKFWLCLVSFALIMQAVIGKWDVTPLFAMNSPFCWTMVEWGHFNGSLLLIQPGITILTLYILQRYLSQEAIAIFGLLSMITESLVMAFSTKSWMLYLSMIVGSSGPITMAMIRSIVSHLTNSKEQGSVFAGLGTVEAISGMTSSLFLSSIYAHSLSWMKGFVFIVTTIFFFSSIILLLILLYVKRQEKSEQSYELSILAGSKVKNMAVKVIEIKEISLNQEIKIK